MLNEIYQALDPIAFWVGPFAVRWYGLGYIFGILLGGAVIMRICKRWKINFSVDALLTVFIAAVLGIVIGARLGYVLFYGEGYYWEHPAEIFAFSEGGMSFHGGVLGMVVAAYIASRIIKMPFATLGDLIVIVAPIGIFLVRVANFINGELWGAPTDLPWGVEFESGGGIARHPSQLYEAMLEGLVLFVVMMILAWRKPPLPRCSYIGVFMILYAVFRTAVEFVREPDAHIGYLAGDWLTMGMVLCIPMFIIGVMLLVYAAKTKRPQKGILVPAGITDDEMDDEEDATKSKKKHAAENKADAESDTTESAGKRTAGDFADAKMDAADSDKKSHVQDKPATDAKSDAKEDSSDNSIDKPDE